MVADHAACIIVPTRDTPDGLARLLRCLSRRQYPILVVDSSRSACRALVADLCLRYESVSLIQHYLRGAAAARNLGVQHSPSAEVIVFVDSDMVVPVESIDRLVDEVRRFPAAVAAGPILIAGEWSAPAKMRRIGYACPAGSGEQPDFLISGLIACSSSFIRQYPWNERILTSEDRFLGAVARKQNVPLLWIPQAVSYHPQELTTYGVAHQRWHVYANVFDALLVRRSAKWLVYFEALGLAAALSKWGRSLPSATRVLMEWVIGNLSLARDLPKLIRIYGSGN